MKTKLREFETLGFRPQNEEQDKLIHDAQMAAGIKMSDLLRRAVLLGLPCLMDEIRHQQASAFERFNDSLSAAQVPTVGNDGNMQDLSHVQKELAIARRKLDAAGPAPYPKSSAKKK